MEPQRTIEAGTKAEIRFRVSSEMVDRFAEVSGDASALHTDTAFARGSRYRKKVVHGMLPVLFLAALEFERARAGRWFFRRLSGTFARPVFVGDSLRLSATLVSAEEREGPAEIAIEYSVSVEPTKALATSGHAVLQYSGKADSRAEWRNGEGQSLIVLDDLVERTAEFEEIHKNDEHSLSFRVSDAGLQALGLLIAEGVGRRPLNLLDPATLLATGLCSTFVGMCMPGRYATFVSFDAQFREPIALNRRYTFAGRVAFTSRSTSSLVENITIADEVGETVGNGRLHTLVHQPPARMPSVEELRETAMNLGIAGKVALVTGASRGLGETIAKMLSLYGARVAVNYVSGVDAANEVVAAIVEGGGEAIAVRADVADRAQVRHMLATIVDRFGPVDILVNNAVRDARPIPFLELTWDMLLEDLDVVLRGAFNCCQEVLPAMVERRQGKIVNVSTIFAENPPAKQAKYVIAKNALVGLTRSLAIEFAHHNIQVNMVVPSIVETDLARQLPRVFLEGMKNATPMKRNAMPVDIARAVVFLASSLCSFTTGQKIMTTGGNPPLL